MKSVFLLVCDEARRLFLGVFILGVVFVLFYLTPFFKAIMQFAQYQEGFGTGFGLSIFLTGYVFVYLAVVSAYVASRAFSLFKNKQSAWLYLLLPMSLGEKVCGFFATVYLIPLLAGGIFSLFLLFAQRFISEIPLSDVFSYVDFAKLCGGWLFADYFLFVTYLFFAGVVFQRFPIVAAVLLYLFFSIVKSRFVFYDDSQLPFYFFEPWFKALCAGLFSCLVLSLCVYFIKDVRYAQWDGSLLSRGRIFSFASFLVITLFLIFIHRLAV